MPGDHDVRDFGAVGNGIDDDTTALRRAIDTAAGATLEAVSPCPREEPSDELSLADRPRRPTPAVCSSARTTVPCGAPLLASLPASVIVDPTVGK